MKVALCSVVSDEFVAGFICMYRTLLQHNPTWAEYPFFIFSHKKNCPLSEKAKVLMAEHCEKIVFVEVNNDDYAGIHHYAETVIGTPPRLRAAFYILESFRLQNFDLVVSLDSDMIVLGPLDELLWEEHRFSSVRARDSTTNMPMRFVNTGVMVIGDFYLYPDILKDFTKALKTRPLLKGSGKADQAIVNIFFQNETINYLPLKFNFTKRMVFNLLGKDKSGEASKVRRFLAERDVRILHYVERNRGTPSWRRRNWSIALLRTSGFRPFIKPPTSPRFSGLIAVAALRSRRPAPSTPPPCKAS